MPVLLIAEAAGWQSRGCRLLERLPWVAFLRAGKFWNRRSRTDRRVVGLGCRRLGWLGEWPIYVFIEVLQLWLALNFTNQVCLLLQPHDTILHGRLSQTHKSSIAQNPKCINRAKGHNTIELFIDQPGIYPIGKQAYSLTTHHSDDIPDNMDFVDPERKFVITNKRPNLCTDVVGQLGDDIVIVVREEYH